MTHPSPRRALRLTGRATVIAAALLTAACTTGGADTITQTRSTGAARAAGDHLVAVGATAATGALAATGGQILATEADDEGGGINFAQVLLSALSAGAIGLAVTFLLPRLQKRQEQRQQPPAPTATDSTGDDNLPR